MNTSFYIDGPTSKNLTSFKKWFYDANYPQNSAAQQQANIDAKFRAGDQRLNLLRPSSGSNQTNLYFNHLQRHTNLLTGHQRQRRRSTVALGAHESYDKLANQVSVLTSYSERKEQFQEFHSDSFDSCITQGQSLLEMVPDYTDDPYSPDFKLNLTSRVNYIIDSNFKRMDLTDCSAIWRRSWIGKEVAKQSLPGREKEIDKMIPSGYKDQKFPLQIELQYLDINKLHCYDEVFYLDTREATMIEDPIAGQSYEFIKQPWEPEDTLDLILKSQPWLKVKKAQKPTIKLCISLDNREMYNGPNLLGIDRYPFAPYMCYFERDLGYSYRERGIIRDLRDTQWLTNRLQVLQLQIFESQPNSGWIYPVDAVVDESAFRQTLNGVLIPLKKGKTVDEIKKIETAHIDPSIFQLSETLQSNFEKISGINAEAFGMAEDDIAGILAMQRRASSMVTVQGIMDRLDFSQQIMGQIRLEAMQKNWSKEKIAKILDEDIDDRFFYTSVTNYNLMVEEGPYSETQRQTQFKQALYLQQLGVPLSPEYIVKKSLIFDKEEVLEDMANTQAQQAQQQQAQAQQEQQKSMSQNILDMAKAKVDLARAKDLQYSAQERKAKVVDIFASAEKKETSSDLDIVEKMIKLEDMSFNQLKNSFELAQTLKEQQNRSSYDQIREI